MSLARGRTNDATGTTGRGHGRTKLEDDLQRRPDAWAVIGFEENAGSADVDAATPRPPQLAAPRTKGYSNVNGKAVGASRSGRHLLDLSSWNLKTSGFGVVGR